MSDDTNFLLNQGFENPNGISFDDSIGGTRRLNLDQIQVYEFNPRVSENEKYEEIKESIRMSGLQNPFTVTRRPGNEHFTIKAGGNTRLSILKELWEETGDPVFYELECRFEPWTSDLDLLGAHMTENELRDDMTFYDKAVATMRFKHLIEEKEGKELSQRELCDKAAKTGWIIHQSILPLYEYAFEILSNQIPIALRSRLGRTAVQNIRKWEQAFYKYGEIKCSDNEFLMPERCVALWLDALSYKDSEKISIEESKLIAIEQISKLTQEKIFTIQSELDAIYDGKDIFIKEKKIIDHKGINDNKNKIHDKIENIFLKIKNQNKDLIESCDINEIDENMRPIYCAIQLENHIYSGIKNNKDITTELDQFISERNGDFLKYLALFNISYRSSLLKKEYTIFTLIKELQESINIFMKQEGGK